MEAQDLHALVYPWLPWALGALGFTTNVQQSAEALSIMRGDHPMLVKRSAGLWVAVDLSPQRSSPSRGDDRDGLLQNIQ